ncbi:undecaprenyl-phosphate glucose phosphotransferase [Prosthecomicrobium sp. N25]|uniref:undecaprenyl-phosphate glucose phosphotransferase n=1 Tax=Prosthecomicrobium sp. N25 TaxID=3129254 RepID=UPI003077ECDC
MSNAEIGHPLVGAPLDRGKPATAAEAGRLSDHARTVATRLVDQPISAVILKGMVRAVELVAVFVLGAVLAVLVPYEDEFLDRYIAASALASIITVFLVHAAGGYSVSSFRPFVPTLARVLVAWLGVFALLAILAFLFQLGQVFSRLWLVSWFTAGSLFFVAERVALAQFARKWAREGRLERRAVIVGGGAVAADLIASLEAQPDNDIRICGVFDDRGGDRSPAYVAGYPKLGTIDELVEFGRMTRLDMLIVTIPVTAESRVLELLKKLWVLPVDIRLSAHASRLKFRPRSYSYVGNVPFIDVADKPLGDWDRVMKRGFDLFFGISALVALAPVMIATAIAVKLDSRGPVFFRQKRYGFNNEVIDVWKFRSMYADQNDYAAQKLVTRDDPRVTRVGRFIRKASIDELPQLFNVIAGSLSLVGPRPHALAAKAQDRLYEQVVDSYFARHRVKPGVTGWAQINGWRGETDTPDKIQKRVDCDLYYIENWSLTLDLYILFATPFRLLNENAY